MDVAKTMRFFFFCACQTEATAIFKISFFRLMGVGAGIIVPREDMFLG